MNISKGADTEKQLLSLCKNRNGMGLALIKHKQLIKEAVPSGRMVYKPD